jgi:hypothetical protein
MGEDRETGPDVTAVHHALWSDQTVADAQEVLGGWASPAKSPRQP